MDKELFRTDLQQIFGMLECRGDKDKLKEYMEQEKDYFGHLDRETATAVSVFLGSEVIKNKVLASQKEEMMDICKALQDIYNDGVGEEIAEMLETTVEEVHRLR